MASVPVAPLDLGPLAAATEGLTTPYAAVDLDAFDANVTDMTARAHGLPIRLASKSLRCRTLMDRALTGAGGASGPGFRGVLAYSVVEALWLARHSHGDVVVGYPTIDLDALTELGQDPALAAAVTVMVDSRAHLDLIDRAAPVHPIRVAIDIDASLRLGPLHLGVRRSPVHTPTQAADLARQISRRDSARLVGLMLYDAQIAGLPDASAAVRLVKRASEAELARRRAAVVAAVQPYADLELVNGGGTGSLHLTSGDGQLTELAGGSGLYGPTLFDGYRAFTPRPAMVFATSVVRRPSPGHATVYSGGYVASGPPGRSRVPTPVWPRRLELLGSEAAGEVQTPLAGPGAAGLQIGDRVFFRHAKAGEACERFDRIHLVRGGELVDTVPTYRGEGMNFG
ncbi:amino acid deaminase/aldolase [Microlunatus aurantiacus]|uniref:Amino acid deaminase/aldolase n=1 Tax=Microlunatus aurantiacus TaxID=446786 RepID=A0ABP7DDV5_9ACTN